MLLDVPLCRIQHVHINPRDVTAWLHGPVPVGVCTALVPVKYIALEPGLSWLVVCGHAETLYSVLQPASWGSETGAVLHAVTRVLLHSYVCAPQGTGRVGCAAVSRAVLLANGVAVARAMYFIRMLL